MRGFLFPPRQVRQLPRDFTVRDVPVLLFRFGLCCTLYPSGHVLGRLVDRPFEFLKLALDLLQTFVQMPCSPPDSLLDGGSEFEALAARHDHSDRQPPGEAGKR